MIIKVCAVGMAAVIMTALLKGYRSELVPFIGIGAALIIGSVIVWDLYDLIEVIKDVADKADISSSYIAVMIKMLGIAYISEIATSMCRDSGNNMIAGQIEIFAKISMLSVSVPVIKNLINTIMECL